MTSLVAYQLARRFSIQRDSELLRKRIAAAQRASMVRRCAHWPTRGKTA